MLNKVILMGRLTSDPELRQSANNISSCRFTVAVDRDYTPQGQDRQADFISVTAWRQTAEFVSKYFHKGSMIIVEGSLRTGSYNDKKYPDVKHFTTDVQADRVQFGESKRSAGDNGEYAERPTSFEPPKQESPKAPQEANPSLAIGNLNDFEEILGDDELPF